MMEVMKMGDVMKSILNGGGLPRPGLRPVAPVVGEAAGAVPEARVVGPGPVPGLGVGPGAGLAAGEAAVAALVGRSVFAGEAKAEAAGEGLAPAGGHAAAVEALVAGAVGFEEEGAVCLLRGEAGAGHRCFDQGRALRAAAKFLTGLAVMVMGGCATVLVGDLKAEAVERLDRGGLEVTLARWEW